MKHVSIEFCEIHIICLSRSDINSNIISVVWMYVNFCTSPCTIMLYYLFVAFRPWLYKMPSRRGSTLKEFHLCLRALLILIFLQEVNLNLHLRIEAVVWESLLTASMACFVIRKFMQEEVQHQNWLAVLQVPSILFLLMHIGHPVCQNVILSITP